MRISNGNITDALRRSAPSITVKMQLSTFVQHLILAILTISCCFALAANPRRHLHTFRKEVLSSSSYVNRVENIHRAYLSPTPQPSNQTKHHTAADTSSTALSALESQYVNITTNIHIDASNNGSNSGISPARCKDGSDALCDLGRGNGGAHNATSNATCLDFRYGGNYTEGFCQFWSHNGTGLVKRPHESGVGRGATVAIGLVMGFFIASGVFAMMTRVCLVGGGI